MNYQIISKEIYLSKDFIFKFLLFILKFIVKIVKIKRCQGSLPLVKTYFTKYYELSTNGTCANLLSVSACSSL
jgi:hypothetical protein